MPNSLGINEVTLAELADSTDPVNTIGGLVDDGAGGDSVVRDKWNSTVAVRVTDYEGDSGATGEDVSGMAIFVQKSHWNEWRVAGVKRQTDGADNVVLPLPGLLIPAS